MALISGRKPQRFQEAQTHSLIFWLEDDLVYAPLKRCYLEAVVDGWDFIVADQKSSWCWYQRKLICIALYAWNRKSEYLTYVLAHELAHYKAGHSAGHGPEFMEWFKYLCPKHLQHHELDYKPIHAMAAGIVPEDF